MSRRGGYIQEELAEMTRWANQYLGVGGYSDHLITDLSSDLADGITLLRLVQSLCGEALPKHSPNPLMKVQRIENVSVALDYLNSVGVHLSVHPEELVGGSVKGSLALCKALRRHYTAGPSYEGHRGKRAFSISSLDKEDSAVLSWLGDLLHRSIHNYSVLYDGRCLCDLVNELREDTISAQESWSSERRLREALTASETHFFIPPSGLDLTKVATGSQNSHLRSYLQHMRTVHLSRPHTPSVHHSQSSREEALIAARSYEGLRARKTGSYSDLTTQTSRPLAKHSSTDSLSQPPLFAPLHRHYSVDTGIAPLTRRPPPSLLRTSSQTIPHHRSSIIEGINTHTFEGGRGLNKRSLSTARLESSSVDELTSLVAALEERLATLTAQFLFERHDMYKRMDRALVRERKRRQAVEKRLRDVEALARTLVKHYDSKFIEMAKQVSVLRGELLVSQAQPTPVTMEIAAIKDKVGSLEHRVASRAITVQAPAHGPRQRSQTLFVRKALEPRPVSSSTSRKRSSSKPDKVYSRGPVTSFKKLSAFFGVEPPRLEDITTFLEGLGYSDLIQRFTCQDISLAELAVMGDDDLERLGVPLGPRLRILQELKKLKPLNEGTVI